MTAPQSESQTPGALFSDPECARLFSDMACAVAMVTVERALARAEARLGIIPAAAAATIDADLADFEPDVSAIAAGVATSGTPVIALVDQLRHAVGADAADFVHWGATSQDIVDTGLLLRLRRFLELCSERLDGLIGQLAVLADTHRGAVMPARTRMQHALPTVFGMTAANWLMPLVRHRDRLSQLQPRLLVVQCGGAAGTLAALGDKGVDVMSALAEELDLGVPPTPWHTQRDSIAECASWLGLVTGSLGKIAQDIVLLGQTEIGEVRDTHGGGSSTMPQKANPVRAEAVITLARANAAALSSMHQAVIQEHERGGAGWSLEWLTLPQMAVAAGTALLQMQSVIDGLEVFPKRMSANLSLGNGLILSEAITFALTKSMGREQAVALVKAANDTAREESRPLVEVVREQTDAAVDWDALGDPASYLGVADGLIDRALAAARGETA